MAGLATASLAVTATSCGGGGTSGSFDDTVTVGILHSLSGTMAISESTLVDTEKMAIEEINAAGGVTVGGKSYKIEYIVEDGASDWPTFAEKSKKLSIVEGAQQSKERDIPEYIKSDSKSKSIQLVRIPKFSEVPYPVIMEPNLVIEYYSR